MAFDINQKILVVDDMATMRKIIIRMLNKKGCTNIVEAEDGQQAWDELDRAANADDPVLFVMSDWNMPNVSGLTLLKKMKSDERFKATPFLMVTAEGDKDSVMTAVKAGINNFVVKPFSIETLNAKIDKIFAA
jgi:two-component system chemotaxis response regulator CheY